MKDFAKALLKCMVLLILGGIYALMSALESDRSRAEMIPESEVWKPMRRRSK